MTPQPDAHNGLQINIPIPPPTKESRDKTVQNAKAAVDKAASAVRDSRGSVHKRLQDMQKKKVARPDDVRKAQDQMEKLTEKGQKELKDLFETSKKALERAWAGTRGHGHDMQFYHHAYMDTWEAFRFNWGELWDVLYACENKSV